MSISTRIMSFVLCISIFIKDERATRQKYCNFKKTMKRFTRWGRHIKLLFKIFSSKGTHMNLRSIFLSSALKRVAMSVFISSTLKTLYRKKQMLISLAIEPDKFSYPLTTITQRKTEGIYVHKLNWLQTKASSKKNKGKYRRIR